MGLLDFAFDDTFTPAPIGANPFQTPFVPMTGAAPAPMGMMPSVLPRRSPRRTMYQDPILAMAAQQQGMSPSGMAMPSVLPKSKPQMQGPMPAPTPMGAPDFVTAMPEAKLVTPQQMAPQGGLLGNMFDADINSAKARGILGASAALLDAGGPRVGAPAASTGQAIASAITKGLGAYDAQLATEEALKSQAITDRYKQAQAAQMEAAVNQPILQDLGNGAFTRVTDPVTGESKIIENTDVKNYLEELAIKKQTKNINLSDKQIEAQTEELDNIASNNDLLSQTDGFLDLIDDGKLEFSLFDAMGDSIALTTGLGDTEEAMNSQAFTRYINRLRNELLRMAKGVQTEGDAQRVIDELVTGVESRNTESVKKALVDLRKFQNQTIKRLKSRVQNRRKEKGLSKYDFGAEATADGVGYSVVEDDD